MSKRKSQPASTDAPTEDAPQGEPAPEVAASPSEAEGEEDTSPGKAAARKSAAPARPEPKRWRVRSERFVSVNGMYTRVVEGQIIDPLGYSEQTIASLRTQGVELDPA